MMKATHEKFRSLEPPPGPRRPMMARCSYCHHHWALLYLPMELHEAARTIKAAHCPKCNRGSEYIYVGEGEL
jgi:hypothetical protein